jgi:hypothetical protein
MTESESNGLTDRRNELCFWLMIVSNVISVLAICIALVSIS